MQKALVSVEEYLMTSYSPDVDYVDGVIEERNWGEKDHGKLQLRMVNLLNGLPGVFGFIETRLKVRETRYRIPDICVYVDGEPEEQVFTQTPFLCVEVLSPDDRLNRVMAVARDYLEMGVPNIWVLDPWNNCAYVADGGGLHIMAERISTADGRISFGVDQLFV